MYCVYLELEEGKKIKIKVSIAVGIFSTYLFDFNYGKRRK